MTQTVTPKPAASLILLKGDADNPDVLLGKRRRDLRFMPGYAVFPGGRVDQIDLDAAKEMKTTPNPLKGIKDGLTGIDHIAHSLAACRECIEETGYLPRGTEYNLSAAEHPYVTACAENNYSPVQLPLPCIAQAITPKGSPVRFNARFFVHIVANISQDLEPEGELTNIGWFKVQDALRDLPIADVTEFALKESHAYYRSGKMPEYPPLLTYDHSSYSVLIAREP